ncbi:MAG: BMP family ABC transporter substrate-binding protein [Desulfovibrionaceae bacterium]|nr:BMP family ABC transporter substrate-binding protein [Desulfovibrionaceae bacterium]
MKYISLALLALCLWAQPALPQAARFALLLENPLGDKGWRDQLAAGVQQAAARWQMQGDILIESQPEKQAALFARAAADYDLVLVHASVFSEFVKNQAGNFPKTRFGCIDLALSAENIMSVIFDDGDIAFLAGAAAAIVSQSPQLPGIRNKKEVGWVNGQNNAVHQNLFNAFAMGVHTIDPSIRVTEKVLGTYTDPALGRSVGHLLYADMDVVGFAAGTSNEGGIQAAQETGRYAFGMDSNQDSLAPGHVIFSLLKRPDMAVNLLVQHFAEKTFEGRKVLHLGLNNGGVALTDGQVFKQATGKNFPPALERRLEELRLEIEKGTIQTSTRKKGELCDCL